jgi:hypothetical protein
MTDKTITTEDSEAVTEPITLHCLANAMEALMAAKEKTEHGFLADYCENALREVRKAIGCMGNG